MRRDRHDQGGQGCRSLYYFNPHSHEGSDENLSTKRSVASTFQSTLPRRERLSVSICRSYYLNISIHTPTKGATITARLLSMDAIFQSTLPRRERPFISLNTRLSNEISIHTPTKGATLSLNLQKLLPQYFNPHSHEGSDSIRVCACMPSFADFNPHSHEGSDSAR